MLSDSEMDSFANDFDEKIDQRSYNDQVQRGNKVMPAPRSDSESDGGILSDELDERSYTPMR